ncbi:MAG: family 10 glycosylhydrolase [bacterium]
MKSGRAMALAMPTAVAMLAWLGILVAFATILPGAAPADADELEIDPFDYASPEQAQAAWVAQAGSPPVQVAEGGPWGQERLTVFPCDFSVPGRVRCYWDRTIGLDLSPFSVIELRLYCPDPAPVGLFSLYFRSGNGWYRGGAQLTNAGWNLLRLQRGEFAIEGSPSGWDSIDGIRISPWRGQNTDAVLYADRLRAYDPTVWIVEGTLTEQAYGWSVDSYCEVFTTWLDQYGVAYAMTTDEGVESGVLDGSRLAIFPYNPLISDQEYSQIAAFTSAGGVIMTFYDMDERVTALQGIARLGWNGADVCAMAFVPETIEGLPDRALQASWNFMEVSPAAPETQVLAYWEDCDGTVLGFPAWLDGPKGAYLSHVLLRDDPAPKQQALFAIILHHVPELGPAIAAGALAWMGRVALYQTFDEAYAAIALMVPHSMHRAEAEEALAAAVTAKNAAEQAFALGAYIDVLPAAAQAHESLVQAFALCQLPRADEVRAIWDHDGTGPWPGDWDRSAALLADNGFTSVLPNMLWGGLAHYPSNLLPRSETYYTYGDQIAACLAACAPYGIQVHVWKVNWNLARAPLSFISQMRSQQRTQKDVWGGDVDWLCPSNPLNLELERASMCEVAQWYNVAGLHFDYIRYPDETCCYCDGCRQRFEAYRGAPVANWPLDCYSGTLHDQYRDWRALQITQLVQAVHDAAKAIRPEIELSAAVFSAYPDCRESVGQDWVSWVEQGLLDMIMPMDYTDSPGQFAAMLEEQLALVEGRVPVYPGIGASSPGLPVDQVIVQALETRNQATGGFTMFALDMSTATDILPWLGVGLTYPAEASVTSPGPVYDPPGGARLLRAPEPNPACGWTRFQFGLPSDSHVRLRIVDATGRIVATLIDRPLLAGPHQLTWSPLQDALPSGVYFLHLEAGSRSEARKLVWIR